MIFGRKKSAKKTFDRDKLYPVIRSSICTGEKVAGFKHKGETGFDEIMLIRNESDMQEFLNTYGLTMEEVKIEY